MKYINNKIIQNSVYENITKEILNIQCIQY